MMDGLKLSEPFELGYQLARHPQQQIATNRTYDRWDASLRIQ